MLPATGYVFVRVPSGVLLVIPSPVLPATGYVSLRVPSGVLLVIPSPVLPVTGVPEGAVEDSVRRMLSLVVANEDTMWLTVEIGDAVVVVVIVVVDIVVIMVDMVVVVAEVDVVVDVAAATKQPKAYFTPN